MTFHNAFIPPSRGPGDTWFFAGLTKSFPDINDSGSIALSDRLLCDGSFTPGCKAFYVPSTGDSADISEVDVEDTRTVTGHTLREQVIVFQYRGKFHAVDHVSLPFAVFSAVLLEIQHKV